MRNQSRRPLLTFIAFVISAAPAAATQPPGTNSLPPPLAQLTTTLALSPTLVSKLANTKPYKMAGLLPASRRPQVAYCATGSEPDSTPSGPTPAQLPAQSQPRPHFALGSWLAAVGHRQPRLKAAFPPTDAATTPGAKTPEGTSASSKPQPVLPKVKDWQP